MLWDLTAELWSLTDPQDVERRLQRRAAKLIRSRGTPQYRKTALTFLVGDVRIFFPLNENHQRQGREQGLVRPDFGVKRL